MTAFSSTVAWQCTPDLSAEQQAFYHAHLAAFGVSPQNHLPASGLYIYADELGLALAKAGSKGLVRVDFAAGVAQHRRLYGGGELLGKAVNHRTGPTVWDGTGGLGRDAFVLASLGLQVTVFERHPVVAALLADGLQRAAHHAEVAPIAKRIRFFAADMRIQAPLLLAQEAAPDVVYLDPMYPQRQKSAAVKKEMAYFHELVGLADEEVALLHVAQSLASKRVVVKRPQGGAFLADAVPSFQYQGKNIRFDAYLPHVIP